jgi:hypothetical protein
LWRLESRPQRQIGFTPVGLYVGTVVLRLIGAALIIWVAAIHLHLWDQGYRQIPTYGPLLLADAIGGFALAAVLVAWPRALSGLLGAGYMASTLAALIVSINVHLFGFQESVHAPFVTEAILLEAVGAVVLLTWAVMVLRAQPKRTSR